MDVPAENDCEGKYLHLGQSPEATIEMNDGRLARGQALSYLCEKDGQVEEFTLICVSIPYAEDELEDDEPEGLELYHPEYMVDLN